MEFRIGRQLGALGAEIEGVDIAAPLAEADVRRLVSAWHENLVLLFRGQRMDDAALARFSRNFGVLERAPIQEQVRGRSHAPGLAEVAIVSNVIENGVAIGALGDGDLAWHTDMSYIDQPPPASILYAVELPAAGGDTWFMNMYSAYAALPQNLKHRIAGLKLKHDASHTSAGTLRQGFTETNDFAQVPGAVHSMVLRHPKTGRDALYLGRRPYAYIMGLLQAESEALLDELWAHAVQPQFAIRHQWRAGDVLMWDNRCTMHRRDHFDPSARRILHRTQVNSSALI